MNSIDLLIYSLSSKASECEMLCLTQGQWAAMGLFLGLCIFKFAELALVPLGSIHFVVWPFVEIVWIFL